MRHASVKKCMTAALLSITAGCATTDYHAPCSVPPTPKPPTVEAQELDPLPDDVYRRVIERDRQLQDWGLEQRAILIEVCN